MYLFILLNNNRQWTEDGKGELNVPRQIPFSATSAKSNIAPYKICCGLTLFLLQIVLRHIEYYHSRYFIRRFNWPRDHYVTANNCLRIIICLCALRCEVVLLRIILLVRN